MESAIHADSTTDVEDSSTEGSEDGANGTAPSRLPSQHDGSVARTHVSDAPITNTTTKMDEHVSRKRSAESLPSEAPAMKQPKLQTESTASLAKQTVVALSFLKSRSQVAATSSAYKTNNSSKASSRTQQTPPGEQAEVQSTGYLPSLIPSSSALVAASTGLKVTHDEAYDLYTSTRFEGRTSAWQHHETIDEFLRRLPVADPATAAIGPWLWVDSQTQKHSQKREGSSDAFIEAAEPFLAEFEKQRAILEKQNTGKAVATITRKMGPYRDQLAVDLLNTAKKLHLTTGKWMLFPSPEALPDVWRRVAEATAEGKLGPTSKAGTFEPGRHGTVICVYTYDFSDLADIKRVLQCLVDLDIRQKLYYKCDAYTYLHIDSKNKYKLQASLYSSEEVLHDKVKYFEGLITRLKASKGAMEDFLTS